MFKYGNCLGNRNNFETENECLSQCHREDERQSVSICEAPRDHGDGPTRELRYFFNRDSGSCEAFTYTGAGGNGNRFETKEQCERQCGEYRGEDVCSQPMDVGPCDQWQTRFYYDEGTKKCESFSYGGCEGSGNRFTTEAECQSICVSREEPPSDSRGQNEMQNSRLFVLSLLFQIMQKQNICFLQRWRTLWLSSCAFPFAYAWFSLN